MLNILAFWYQVIIASEQLLKDSIALLNPEIEWEKSLRDFYQKHLDDEMHHAVWLKEDLGEHEVVLHFGAAQIPGMIYYLILHVHPVALMGYMLALEGNKIPMEFVEAVEHEHGKSTGRTLRLHAEEDPGHYQELLSQEIPAEWRDLVENTRIQTLKLIEAI